jgi:SsrA-binding protein
MIINNKKAGFNYESIEKYNAGIVLTGSEVKSIRNSSVNLTDTFCYIKNGELWVKNLKISRYKNSHPSEIHDENRDKKLLLKREEIKKIQKQTKDLGKTIIVLSIIVEKRIKIKISTAVGKKEFDKRADIKKRDLDRDLKRSL